jgi:ParB family protein of integrating conjugative element (PFGI_1 class)
MNAQAARHRAITPELIDARLNPKGFKANATIVELSDPIADTAMVVTLDQLRAYENNPRTTRNPAYDDIKESIRTRGLDQPPPITRRPGDECYIIRNGGNTRLQILQELWRETHDERFYRIQCLFRPWQSETSVLVGHLAENEVRGNLSFVEKAIGIKKLKDMYEDEAKGKKITQAELVKRLKDDGLPVSRSLVSKMLDCVECLWPAIPEILYRGLGKPQIEKLLSLRSGLLEVHKSHGGGDKESFMDFWLSALAGFDMNPDDFRFSRVEDELIGQLGKLIGRDYRMIQLDLAALNPDPEQEDRSSEAEEPLRSASPQLPAQPSESLPLVEPMPEAPEKKAKASGTDKRVGKQEQASQEAGEAAEAPTEIEPLSEEERQRRIDAHIISPIKHTPFADKKLRERAALDGEILPVFEDCAVHAIPVMVGGSFSRITDVWYIEGRFDNPTSLRRQIRGLAEDIAAWGGEHRHVLDTQEGLGFRLNTDYPMPDTSEGLTAGFVLNAILRIIKTWPDKNKADYDASVFSQILFGGYEIQVGSFPPEDIGLVPLPDDCLIRFFRIARLARRLVYWRKKGEK